MPNVLERRWVGRRVTVRRVVGRGADGRVVFGDVVGDLVRLDAERALIDTRHGPVEVAVDTIEIGKPAPPSTADELALEAVAASGWRPAETGHLGGWLLRADGGFTARANSVLPLRAPGLPLDEALDQARQWYAERGLPLRFAVPTEGRRLLDAELGERGWPAGPDVHVMAARLDQLPHLVPTEVTVTITDLPDDAWLARYRGGAGATPVGRALLTRHDTLAFASVRRGDDTVAIGRGSVDERWLGITAVEVDPAVRRTGVARAVMAALWAWGRDHGAERSYLQVGSDNAAAVGLYRALGYWVHHDYRYRSDPTAPAAD